MYINSILNIYLLLHSQKHQIINGNSSSKSKNRFHTLKKKNCIIFSVILNSIHAIISGFSLECPFLMKRDCNRKKASTTKFKIS